MIRTPPATLQKIYNLPDFCSTLEFLTMLALSGGRLLKVYKNDTKPIYCVSNYSVSQIGRNSRSKFLGSSGS